MFAEKTELQLMTDLNETALVELNAADVDDVSGAIAWAAIPVAWKIGGALVAGVGTGAGLAWLSSR